MHVNRAITAIVILLSVASAPTLASDWTNPANGLYTDAGNWSGGVPNAAGAVADFSTLNFSGDISVTVNGVSPTVGTLDFGDTDNAGSPTSWEIRTDDATIPFLTLDNSGSTPLVNVDPLGVTGGGFDDAYIGLNVAGSNGFQKTGDGILTLGGDNTGLTGPIDVSGGTLRFDGGATYAGAAAPIALADNTTLTITNSSIAEIVDVSIAAGGSATLNTGTDNLFMENVTGAGTGQGSNLNVNLGDDGNTYTLDGQWTGFDSVAFTGQDAAGVSNIRLRANGGGFNFGSFADTAVTLNNTNAFARPFSHGGRILMGSLSGDATASISGGDGGTTGATAPTYVVGALNTNTEFAGVINGAGGGAGAKGMFFEKIGTGTLTLSGSFNGTFVNPDEGDDGEKGGVFRVSEGTVALTNTFDNIAGGVGVTSTVIDVAAGATLDVSGVTSATFSTSALQEVRGAGTIVGPYNHDEGDLRPGDVAGPDGPPQFDDGQLVHTTIPTAGTLSFAGSLEFNGGNINFDMDNTPAGTNDLLSVTGTASVAGGGTISPNFLNGAPAADLVYTVVSTTDGISDSPSGWTVNWFGRGAAPTVSVSGDGNDLQFTTTDVAAVGDVVWVGDESTTWDVQSATETNWTLSGNPDVYFQGDNTTFNDTATSFTVDIVENVSPTSITVNNSANDYTFNNNGGGIVGAGTFLKQGTGMLTMQIANSFSGDATIQQGTVDIGSAGGALGTGALNLTASPGNSATVITTAGSFTNTGLTVSDFGTNTFQVDGGSGAGNLTGIPVMSGTGNLAIISTVNDKWIRITDTGGFNGLLTIGGDGVTSTSMTARINGFFTDFSGAAVTLQNGVVLANESGTGFVNSIELGSLSGDATSVLNGFIGGGTAPETNWEIGHLNADSTFAGTIIDGSGGPSSAPVVISSSVTKVGSGTLTLSGTNAYTGDTAVEGGTLSITSDFLADGADVYLTTGAILDLDFGDLAIIDEIDALFFDGASQAVGTWGRIGSGADNESSFFTGDGLLMVSTLEALAGDFDNDGFVDGTDFLLWQRNPAVGSLQDWQDNYGTGTNAQANTSAVPEPGAALLIVCGMTGLLALRRKAA